MTSSTPMRIAFLLGSGVSIPAGMPSTRCITERVLSGQGFKRYTNETYDFGDLEYPDGFVRRVLSFLNSLKDEIARYYQNKRPTNYEDLYYMATQIYDSISGEHDNPAVQPLIDKILPEMRPLLVGKENESKKKWKFHELAEETRNYIHDVVWHLLEKEPSCLDRLGCIEDACQDRRLSNVDIFTVNHDTVLEQYLSQNGIRFTDGFGEPVDMDKVRYWNPDLFERKPPRVRLFKLHGSVNWFRLRPDSGDQFIESIIRVPPLGRMQQPVDDRPMLLIGTFNKMLQYTSGVYIVLHCQFYRSLRRTQNLIVCGYGFGDKGINTRIVEWICSSSDHKIIVIHPEPERLKSTARGAIRYKWEGLKKQNRLTIIPKRIEKTNWQEIKDRLLV